MKPDNDSMKVTKTRSLWQALTLSLILLVAVISILTGIFLYAFLSYKSKIQCSLTNSCRVCGKRGCASERFLQETHFFIKEYLDNFVEA